MKEIFAALIFLAGLNLVSVGNCCSAQVLPKKVTISGYVSDSDNGEMLAGVTIYENTLKTGTSTNAYGFYSLTIPAGSYNLQYSYIGYQTLSPERGQ
ncbi:MAG: carboxypeptidase-like regulatory domain-containing protein [Bacteroidales bacterium]|nr:carboxypeptidase-like regulatory domain-containing protein [Bacteroidales bacterium]